MKELDLRRCKDTGESILSYPMQALEITGTAKYLRQAKAARIAAKIGAGKTFMALGAIHILAAGPPSATPVMCPSHVTYKWAREAFAILTRARTFAIEDDRLAIEAAFQRDRFFDL